MSETKSHTWTGHSGYECMVEEGSEGLWKRDGMGFALCYQDMDLVHEILRLSAELAEAEGRWNDWAPTAEDINALPDKIREYVYLLETRADPALEVRDMVRARDEARSLETLLAEAEEATARARAEGRMEGMREMINFVLPQITGAGTQICHSVANSANQIIAAAERELAGGKESEYARS